jgi:hypothetical protein
MAAILSVYFVVSISIIVWRGVREISQSDTENLSSTTTG